ncbi:MAG: class I SAM-dependent methyltransferase [Acidobacteriota bacterium]
MSRLHLFELEDQPWLPASVRAYSTDCLRAFFSFLIPRTRVGERLRNLLEAVGEKRILDLCSGSSGPLGPLLDELAREGLDVEALLTDLHPHPELTEGLSGRFTYRREPLDARCVPPELPGVRTLFAGFHHFRPEDAVQILADAAQRGRAIAIFEPSSRRPLEFLAVPWIGLFSLLAAPWLRPFRWRRLFWSWVVPLVPAVVVWDGLVSCCRCYTESELRQLGDDALERTGARGRYRFDAGCDGVRGLPAGVTWLVGRPIS